MNEATATNELLIDLSNIESFENILFELTTIIEQGQLQGKSVKINFGDVLLTAGMMSNLQALLKGYEIDIRLVFANCIQTKLAALENGITVSGKKGEIKPMAHLPEEETKEEEQEGVSSTEEFQGDLIDAMNNVLSGSTEEHEIIREETLYVKQTLRSGQKIEHDGNIVIIGDCKPGSEIMATGDITVWGILGGIAHAGAKGNYNSVIRAFRINAIQLRIADLLARKPDSAEFEKMDKNSQFTPEEAKINNGEIIIYSLNSN